MDGLSNCLHVAVWRGGQLLIVSFTDTTDHDRRAVEVALRQEQTAEKAARADTRQPSECMFLLHL